MANEWHTAVMCGRYLLTSSLEAMRQMFRFKEQLNIAPNYNVAPTLDMPIVRVARDGGARELVKARWGLIPFWAKDIKIGYKMINARAETVDSLRSFKNAYKKRRCLIPGSGFFEWQPTGDKKSKAPKQPYLIRLRGGELFAFAGLWETWRNPDDDVVISYTIITTTPNELCAPIHNRMPVILAREDHDRWLDPDRGGVDLLKPYPADCMEAYQVSKRVGKPENNDPQVIERIH